MSFSTQTKEELARMPADKASCELAELAALVRMDGELQQSVRPPYVLNVMTENATVARKVYRLAKAVLQRPVDIVVRRKLQLRKNNVYIVRIHLQGFMDLHQLGLLDQQGRRITGVAKELIKHRQEQKAYLRGAFLAGGSINNPEGTYHLEMMSDDLSHAKALCRLLNKFDLGAKVSDRKNRYVVYLKESEHIVEFLALIGAHHALLEFENIRVVKEMRNQVNRLVNCETANLNKTVDAALRQVENIRFLKDNNELGILSQPLREIAELRLEYPDASLKELGEMLSPTVGKSGVNHRMRKIDEYAEEIRKQMGKKS